MAEAACRHSPSRSNHRDRESSKLEPLPDFCKIAVPAEPAVESGCPRHTVREGLIQEWYNGREALIADGVAGAARFGSGLGRHGDFAKIR